MIRWLPKLGILIKDENFMLPAQGFKMLWERFLTAMNLVGLPLKIVVGNHSHPA
jgi:hypothetical protein